MLAIITTLLVFLFSLSSCSCSCSWMMAMANVDASYLVSSDAHHQRSLSIITATILTSNITTTLMMAQRQQEDSTALLEQEIDSSPRTAQEQQQQEEEDQDSVTGSSSSTTSAAPSITLYAASGVAVLICLSIYCKQVLVGGWLPVFVDNWAHDGSSPLGELSDYYYMQTVVLERQARLEEQERHRRHCPIKRRLRLLHALEECSMVLEHQHFVTGVAVTTTMDVVQHDHDNNINTNDNGNGNDTNENSNNAKQQQLCNTHHDGNNSTDASITDTKKEERGELSTATADVVIYIESDGCNADGDSDRGEKHTPAPSLFSSSSSTTIYIPALSDMKQHPHPNTHRDNHAYAAHNNNNASKKSVPVSVPNLCAICLCEFEFRETIMWSSNSQCHHCFHNDCISTWLVRMKEEDGTTCPCCRQAFVKVDEDEMEDVEQGKQDAEEEGGGATLATEGRGITSTSVSTSSMIVRNASPSPPPL
jgi:hypothetical protein